MSVPKSVVRYQRGKVTYTSSVDRALYTLVELSRAALRDSGVFITRTANNKASKLPGMSSKNFKGGLHNRIKGKGSTFGWTVPWAKTGLPHLEVGIKDDAWYGAEQELGSSRMPRLGILRNSVYNNIPQIIEIQSRYLSALEDEAKALRLISEEEYTGGGDD